MRVRSGVVLRASVLGFVSWLVPFVMSFLAFDRTGQLLIPQPLFKSLMVVVGGAVGTWCLVLAFRYIPASPGTGLVVGVGWLAINLVLDLLILVPLVHMPVALWFYDIGLRYLLLPIVSVGMGAVGAASGSKVRPHHYGRSKLSTSVRPIQPFGIFPFRFRPWLAAPP